MSANASSQTATGRLSGTIAVGALFSVTFTALAHGAVEPWSVVLFEFIVLALILLWGIKIVIDRRFNLVMPTTAFPLAALVVLGIAQSVVFTDESGIRRSLSMNVEATRATVIMLIFLLISFLILTNFFVGRRRLSALAGFLVVYGLAMAVFALVQHFTWNGKFYWIRPNTSSVSPFGPFVNHNHFAGYMELLISIPITLAITRAVRKETRLLYGFITMVMGVAVIASLSRGGMISCAFQMIFLMAMSLWMPKARRNSARPSSSLDVEPKRAGLLAAFRVKPSLQQALAVVVVVVGMVWGIVWIGGSDSVINRVTQGQAAGVGGQAETFFESRGWVWRDTLTMIRANPVTGVGLGAYDTAFSIYSKSEGAIRVPQAHNDYLQIVADGGIVGGAIALWFLILIFRHIMRGIKSSDPLYSGLALGCGTGIFGLLVHSFFDFNLQLPSNALLFLLLTAAVSHISSTVSNNESKELIRPQEKKITSVSTAVKAAAARW